MSDQAMAWARSIKTGSVGRKAVLYVLANHALSDGVVHDCPQAAIAEEAELSERQVRTILGDLERNGVIERERRAGTGKGRQHDIIRLRMAELPLILGAKRSRQPEKTSADEATGSLPSARQPAVSSARKGPKGSSTASAEAVSDSPPQPATGNRQSSPVAHEDNLLEGSYITPRDINPPKPPRRRSARSGDERATRLPENWALPRRLGVKTREEYSYTDHEIRFIAMQFANHWHAATGANARKRDWDKTWFNWVARQNRRSVVEGAKGWTPLVDGAPQNDDGLGAFRAACAFRAQNGEWPARLPGASAAFTPDLIPAAVRGEYPELFNGEMALSA